MLITGRTDPRAQAFEELLVTALKRRSSERYLSAEDMRDALLAAQSQSGPDDADEPVVSLATPSLVDADSRNLHGGARRNGHEGARRDFDPASCDDGLDGSTTNLSVPLRVPVFVPLRVVPVLRPSLPDALPRDASPAARASSSSAASSRRRALRYVVLGLMVLALVLAFLRWRIGTTPGLRVRAAAVPTSVAVDPQPEPRVTTSDAPSVETPPPIETTAVASARPAARPRPPRRPAAPAPTSNVEATEGEPPVSPPLDTADPWAPENADPRDLPPLR